MRLEQDSGDSTGVLLFEFIVATEYIWILTGDMFLFSLSLPLTIQEKVYEAYWGEIIECKDVISHILFMSNIPG